MERKSSYGFIGGAAAAASASVAGGAIGSGLGLGLGMGTGMGGSDRRVLVEWHPFLSDFFVAGGEELQLYEVRRQRGLGVGVGGVGGLGGLGAPNPR